MALLIYGLDQVIRFRSRECPLRGKDMSRLEVIEKGAILADGGKIIQAGAEKNVFENPLSKRAVKMKVGGVALPSFVDSHTHSVFGEPRLADFSMRIAGVSYEEIKKRGGGIASGIKAVREKSASVLEKQLLERARKFVECGTATVEIKTGYGLDFESEIKVLKTIKRLSKKTPLEMVPTLLSAHCVPPEFGGDRRKYLCYIYEKIFPCVGKRGLAVFADIFCEKGFFNRAQTVEYLRKAGEHGLRGKVHAEQLSRCGGIAAAAETGSISADHADFASEEDIRLAAEKKLILTLLPASNFYLGIDRYPDARKMIEAGAPVALSTDFNPGSSPCWNMQEVMSISALRMRMSCEETITASTVNGACALGLAGKTGAIEEGKQADVAVFDAKDYRELSYYFGSDMNKITLKKGKVIYDRDKAYTF